MKYFFAFLALAVCLASAEECTSTSCDVECKKFSWAWFKCEDNECFCMFTPRSTKYTEVKSLKSIIKEAATEPKCTFTDCDGECKKFDYYGYKCEINGCICMKSPTSTEITEFRSLALLKEIATEPKCTLTSCDEDCSKAGYYGYRCEIDECICMDTDTITRITEFKSLESINNGTTDPKCILAICHAECGKVAWHGYGCENSECFCLDSPTITRHSEIKSLERIKNETTQPKCSLTTCYKDCLKVGWYGYRCEKNECFCMNTPTSTRLTEIKSLKSIKKTE